MKAQNLIYLLWVFCCSFAGSSCHKDGPTQLVVHLSGATQDIKTWQVTVTLNQTPPLSKRIEDVAGSTSNFSIAIPAGTQGQVSVTVKGIASTYAFISAKGDSDLIALDGQQRIDTNVAILPVEVCNRDGFCWERPLPSGRFFRSVWGTGESDIWAVGDGGLVLHNDGTAWDLIKSGTDEDLTQVWGRNANEIYVVGYKDVVLKWNGTALESIKTPTPGLDFYGVWAASPTEIWLLGQSQQSQAWKILQSTETGWQSYSDQDLGFTGNAGHPAAISGLESGKPYVLGNLYTSNYSSIFYRRDGATWTRLQDKLTAVTSTDECRDLKLASPTEIYILCGSKVLKFDGVNAATDLQAPAGEWRQLAFTPSGDLWIVGATTPSMGAIYQYEKQLPWTLIKDNDALLTATPFYNVVSAVGQSMFIGARGGILRQFNGSNWSGHLPEIISTPQEVLTRVTGTDSSNLWAVGSKGLVLHRDERKWSAAQPDPLIELSGVHALSSGDVWAVGNRPGMGGQALHFNGSDWTNQSPTGARFMNAVWGERSDEVWSVGDYLEIQKWDGSQKRWNVVTLQGGPTGNLGRYQFRSIVGVRNQGIWAAGGNDDMTGSPTGPVLAFYAPGGSWQDITSQIDSVVTRVSPFRYESVWASSMNDVWVYVGGNGSRFLANFDGTSWFHVPWWSSDKGTVVQGIGPNNVWSFERLDKAGHGTRTSGSITRLGGPLDNDSYILGAWATPSGDLWIVGMNGTIMRRRMQ